MQTEMYLEEVRSPADPVSLLHSIRPENEQALQNPVSEKVECLPSAVTPLNFHDFSSSFDVLKTFFFFILMFTTRSFKLELALHCLFPQCFLIVFDSLLITDMKGKRLSEGIQKP